MSYDINFWRQKTRLKKPPVEIYWELSAGRPVEGLQRLPVKRILERIKKEFPTFEPGDPFIETDGGSLEVLWTNLSFRFDSRPGGANEDEFYRIVKLMAEFRCPLYDPQIQKRFKLNERPPFRPRVPDKVEPPNIYDEIFEAISPDEDLEDAIKKARRMLRKQRQ